LMSNHLIPPSLPHFRFDIENESKNNICNLAQAFART
jgi:hypothetical protein